MLSLVGAGCSLGDDEQDVVDLIHLSAWICCCMNTIWDSPVQQPATYVLPWPPRLAGWLAVKSHFGWAWRPGGGILAPDSRKPKPQGVRVLPGSFEKYRKACSTLPAPSQLVSKAPVSAQNWHARLLSKRLQKRGLAGGHVRPQTCHLASLGPGAGLAVWMPSGQTDSPDADNIQKSQAAGQQHSGAVQQVTLPAWMCWASVCGTVPAAWIQASPLSSCVASERAA